MSQLLQTISDHDQPQWLVGHVSNAANRETALLFVIERVFNRWLLI